MRLESWFVTPATAVDEGVRRDDPSGTPQYGCVCGAIYDHPTRPDGARVVTCVIVAANGRRVTVADGTTFDLGEAAPEYVAWLKAHGLRWDPENPVRMHKRSDPADV